jgi:hypothetical protein
MSLKTFSYNNLISYNDDYKILSLPFEILEDMNQRDILNTYKHLHRVSFINFFISYSIDVPICFKKSPSLKTINSQVNLLKFNNLIMRAGKRESTFRTLFPIVRSLTNNINNINTFINQRDFNFLLTNYLKLNIHNTEILNEFSYFVPSNENENLLVELINVPLTTENFIKNFLIKLLSKISPMFSYFIYNVDKNIRKFSRGKSGKYTFI